MLTRITIVLASVCVCVWVCVWVTVKGDGTILYLVLQGARLFQNSSKWNLIYAFRCTYNCLKNWVNLVFYDKNRSEGTS